MRIPTFFAERKFLANRRPSHRPDLHFYMITGEEQGCLLIPRASESLCTLSFSVSRNCLQIILSILSNIINVKRIFLTITVGLSVRRGITCLKILTKMKLDEFYVLGVHERVGNLEKKKTESITITLSI